MLISRSLPGVPAVDVVLRDGTNTLTADWDVGAHKIENVTDPGSPQDVATKNYVDANSGGNQIFWLSTDTWADVYAKISASPGEAFNVVIPRGQMIVVPGAMPVPPTITGTFVIPAGAYNLDYVTFCSTGPLELWPVGPIIADLVIESGAMLGIRPCTMAVHWRIIFRKFNARTRGQVAFIWARMTAHWSTPGACSGSMPLSASPAITA